MTAILGLVNENMMLSEVDIFVFNGKSFTKADTRTVQQPKESRERIADYIGERIPMLSQSEYRSFTVAMRQQKYHEKHLGEGIAKGANSPR